MFENPAKIQHFISQAEQRLNGIPPNRDKNGISIRNNLAIEDLYSFDKSGELRKNFEKLFQRYEQRITSAVEALEGKLLKKSYTDLDGLLYEIFLLKFLNVRSDLFESLPDLDLSLEEHKKWLKVLLLLLMPNPKSSARPGNHPGNLFEQIAYDLLTDTSFIRAVKIQMLSEGFFAGRFLLNDRSYFYSSEPTDPNKLILNFNISDRIAMTFMIVNPQVLKQYDPFTQNWLIQQSLAEIRQGINRVPVFDDQREVEQFNQGMIFQARRYVFCSQKEVMGATVLEL